MHTSNLCRDAENQLLLRIRLAVCALADNQMDRAYNTLTMPDASGSARCIAAADTSNNRCHCLMQLAGVL